MDRGIKARGFGERTQGQMNGSCSAIVNEPALGNWVSRGGEGVTLQTADLVKETASKRRIF